MALSTSALFYARATNRLFPSEYSEWALSLLELGQDSPNLRILAGLNGDSIFETEHYFQRTIKDLGISDREPEAAMRAYACDIASKIVAHTIAPKEGAHILYKVWVASRYEQRFLIWNDLDSAASDVHAGVYPITFESMTTENCDETIRIEAAKFLSRQPSLQMQRLHEAGHVIITTSVSIETIEQLRDTLFIEGEAGKRCLLDEPLVREVAIALKEELRKQGILAAEAVAIQAIAFDKTPSANWKVAWHQDLMFPFAQAVTSDGYTTPTRKDGIDYARPPVEVLEELLAVRLHLDDCDESNGPLRVSPGTHRLGILSSDAVSQTVAEHGEVVCLAKKGEALLMHPLTLHASSQATSPKHRRVLHFVYHSGAPMTETWHRRI